MNRNLVFLRKYYRVATRNYSNKVEINENVPVKFSTSRAAHKTTVPVIRKNTNDMPWYQPYSIVTSISIFLFYFCVLREENDVDIEFNRTLYERINGLEKEQLIQSYKYNKEHGKSVEDIERRLKELQAKESDVVV